MFAASTFAIYIPLWFYFYRTKMKKLQSARKFTFHYGSTSTSHTAVLLLILQNLHSTMVLLLRSADHQHFIPSWIYIPLWFYFYTVGPISLALAIKFTFHYGSTSTDSLRTPDHASIQIYIPLWFYFYDTFGPVFETVFEFTFHYGSTSTGWFRELWC